MDAVAWEAAGTRQRRHWLEGASVHPLEMHILKGRLSAARVSRWRVIEVLVPFRRFLQSSFITFAIKAISVVCKILKYVNILKSYIIKD